MRVRGLPATMADADVRELFSSCGRITRVVLDRAAYSAGTAPKSALVYFDAIASAEVAVKQNDGIKMRQHTLSVALECNIKAAAKPY